MKVNGINDSLSDSDEEQMDFRGISHAILQKWWLILFCAAIGLGAGLAQISRTPKSYRAQAVLQVDPDGKKLLTFSEDESSDYNTGEALQTTIVSFRSRPFVRQVVENNHLDQDKEFLPPALDGAVYDVDAATNVLTNIISVGLRPGTHLIDVAVEHQNPKVAQRLANVVAEEFIRYTIQQRAANTHRALSFLMDEAAKLQKKVQQSEEARETYKQENNLLSLEASQDTVISKLKNDNAAYMNAKTARIQLEADYAEVKKYAGQPERLLTIPSVANQTSIVAAKQRIADIQSKILTLTLRYTEKHPKMIQARLELADAEQTLNQDLLNIPEIIHHQYDLAVDTEKNFEAALHEQEKAAQQLNQQAIPYKVLTRDAETDRAMYESILKRFKETDIAKGIEANNIQLFEQAQLPITPTKPNIQRMLMMAIAGGLFAGVGLALLMHFTDSSLRTVEEATKVTGLKVIGAIPHSPETRQTSDSVLIPAPDSSVTEAFRSLRAALHLNSKRSGCRTFLFTSSVPAEGKTFCSINYAASLAQQGLRTLLIDADLRAPMVANLLLHKSGDAGVSDYIWGRADFPNAVQTTHLENLFVMPAGTRVTNPAELLASQAFVSMLHEASARFDRIVIDSAPIHAVSDTLLIVEHAPLVCLVALAGKTPGALVVRALEMLSDAGAGVVGLILNQLPDRPNKAYYYYSAERTYDGKGYEIAPVETAQRY
jgi:succinoglycan biosynthesis transport protein ExoP